MMVSIISSWSRILPSSETFSSTVVLFLLLYSGDTRLWSKRSESFAVYLYPHLTLPDSLMGQSFPDYLNLLHAKEVTVNDARESGLIQNEQSLEWSLFLEEQQGLKKDT